MLGRPVWALSDPAAAVGAPAAARAAGVGLIVYRGAAEDAEALEAAGFRPVETLVTFERALKPGGGGLPDGVRLAEEADAPAVAAIAAQAFRHDRWHADPAIPDQRADAFKAAWARNAVLGRAVAVLIAGAAQAAVGFNALMARGDVLVVDLIAVAPGQQGRGHGRHLMAGAMAYGAAKGYRRLRVGTQDSNFASIRLYESLGLKEVGRARTWHWTP
jgi:ribosomal protein S18 acetylase RimI-like enzyme